MGKIHLYAEYSDGEMSECGRGFFADVSFEDGTSNINDVTCKHCIKLFEKREPKRIKDLNDYIAREVEKFKVSPHEPSTENKTEACINPLVMESVCPKCNAQTLTIRDTIYCQDECGWTGQTAP